MRVVFLQEVEGTARAGDVKNVADGFARNYLLPRRLAAPATGHYIAIAQAKATKEARRQDRLDEDAKLLLPKVEGLTLTTEVRVGEQDKLFGSVTARDIAELVTEKTGIEIEHRQVDLKQPIRELGTYEVSVRLTRNVLAPVTINVTALRGPPKAEETAQAEAPVAQAEGETPEPPVVEAEAAEEPGAVEEAEEAQPQEARVNDSTEGS